MNAAPNASERLRQSREMLRLTLRKTDSPDDQGCQSGTESSGADALRKVDLIRDFLPEWWRRQPWRIGLQLAAQAGKMVLQPTAKRHPFVLVAGAATAGAILVALRPWRWISIPALLTGLLPQLLPIATQRRPAPRQER